MLLAKKKNSRYLKRNRTHRLHRSATLVGTSKQTSNSGLQVGIPIKVGSGMIVGLNKDDLYPLDLDLLYISRKL